MYENIDELLENESLKKDFEILNLDLSQIFTPTPDNLKLENRRLRHLLDWVQKYIECRNRKKMEAEGYEFPPIDPCISPENDWYIFERWVNGLPIRSKITDMLPSQYSLKDPQTLNDEEIHNEINYLIVLLEEAGIGFCVNDGIPDRIIYKYLLEILNKESDVMIEGGWTYDGCTGYCPDCFQRPWCDSGGRSCWTEDEEVGKMFICNSLTEFVSASSVSLQILKNNQAVEDENFQKYKMQRNSDDNSIDPGTYNSEGDDEIPF